jgi:hypothetical protein
MKELVKPLPTALPSTDPKLRAGDAATALTPAEGAALRAFRQFLITTDRARRFGGMRRVQAPSGELLWVCPDHYPTYDPGLPTLPVPTAPDSTTQPTPPRPLP